MNPSPSLPRRCLLFVPGCRPDRFDQAVASGADVVCVDLEDSVPPAEKPAARQHAWNFLGENRRDRPVLRAVRLNPLSTRAGLEDLLALVAAGGAPDLLLLPKVRDAAEVRIVRDVWPAAPPLLSLIETSFGVLHAREIAAASPGGIMFGAADLSTELGVAPVGEPIDHARLGLVLAARAAGIEIMDTPSLEVRDLGGLAAEAQRARAWGFGGKAAIHPQQVPIIQAAFTPAAEEVARAERALAAFAAAGEAATLFEGRLLEKPVIEAFRRTLRDAAGPARAS